MLIGYIGIGSLGGAVARRLIPSGRLVVWDRNPNAVELLVKDGAEAAVSAIDLAEKCDIVLLCLPRSHDVEDVMFGAGGLFQSLSRDKLVIDQTSGDPAHTSLIAERLASAGITYIDAPISGNSSVVAEGNATVVTSGPRAGFERASAVLEAIAGSVFYCGERVGDAQAMKLINNLMNASTRLATLEVVAMGRKMGLSLATLTDVINKGSGRNMTSRKTLPAINAGTSSTNFALDLMLKDVNQAVELGMKYRSPMLIGSAVRGVLQIGVNTLGKDARLEHIIGFVEKMACTSIADERQENDLGAAADETSTWKDKRVGYVGLGAMGAALVRRLMLSREMHVFDTREEVVTELVSEGAVGYSSLASLARACDIIITCLPTSAIVEKVLFGDDGLTAGLTPGKIVVDQTTGDPSLTRRFADQLRELGVSLLDAPVSGGPRGAVAGTIAIMGGGPAEDWKAIRAILEEISPNIVYCGEVGNGHVAKLINNTVASCNRLITYEAAALGFKYGLQIEDMDKVINRSSGWSGASERILPVLHAGGQTANFQLELMAKDLKLATKMAIDCGAPLLVASTVRNIFEIGVHELGGTANLDAVAGLFEKMSELSFTAE